MSADTIEATRKQELPSAENIGKSLAIVISIVGIYAWAGGQAFDIGYWQVFGWDGSIVKPSAQEVAFKGLIGPFFNWFWAALTLLLMGLVGLATEFISGRRPRSTNNPAPNNKTQGKDLGVSYSSLRVPLNASRICPACSSSTFSSSRSATTNARFFSAASTGPTGPDDSIFVSMIFPR